jgi:hypothetical protein
MGRRVLVDGGARNWPSADGETAMACLPIGVGLARMELRRERKLAAAAYLFDYLSSARDDAHPGLSGCHHPGSWFWAGVRLGGRHQEKVHWRAATAEV